MGTEGIEAVSITLEQDIVRARQLVRQRAQQLGFGIVDLTKIVTAASELARNTMIHGGGGAMECATLREAGKCGLRLVFRDQGPGIADVALAMRDGWSSGTGLGMGLSGSKRLVNEFAIESQPGIGTTVTITRWK